MTIGTGSPRRERDMEGNWGSTVVIILVFAVAAVAFGAVFRHKIKLARRRFAGPEKGGGVGAAPTGRDAAPRSANADGSTDRPSP